MRLETERLVLREYRLGDAAALSTIISDPETMKYYEKPYDENGVRRWIDWNLENYKTFGFGLWAIERKEDGRFIGDCGITIQNINRRYRPEIGYHIHKDFQRMGYASEAAEKCRDFIFENTPFETVYSYMNAENVGSYRTAEKIGMRQTETYAESGVLHRVYAITRAEWARIRIKG